jgi:hypothetical protein
MASRVLEQMSQTSPPLTHPSSSFRFITKIFSFHSDNTFAMSLVHRSYLQVTFALNAVNSLVFTHFFHIRLVPHLQSHLLVLMHIHSHTHSHNWHSLLTLALDVYVCHVTHHRLHSLVPARTHFALILAVPLASFHLPCVQHEAVPTGTKRSQCQHCHHVTDMQSLSYCVFSLQCHVVEEGELDRAIVDA